MRKQTILALVAMMTLAGCIEEGVELSTNETSIETMTVCLDGVSYWLIQPNTRSQAMAPRIDPVTLQFVRCK